GGNGATRPGSQYAKGANDDCRANVGKSEKRRGESAEAPIQRDRGIAIREPVHTTRPCRPTALRKPRTSVRVIGSAIRGSKVRRRQGVIGPASQGVALAISM